MFDEAHLWSLKKKRADQDSRKMPYVSLPRFHWHHLSRGVRQRLEAQKTVARLGGGAAGMMAAMTAGWVAGEAILKCHGEKMLKAAHWCLLLQVLLHSNHEKVVPSL